MKLSLLVASLTFFAVLGVGCTKTVKEVAPPPAPVSHQQIIGLEFDNGQILLPDALGNEIEFCYATKNYKGEPFLVCTTVGQIKELARNKKLSH